VSRRKRKHTETTPTEQVAAHLPCESCGSSDALTQYSDGHTFCFSCSERKRGEDAEHARPEERENVHLGEARAVIPQGVSGAIPARCIYQETTEKWGYLSGMYNGTPSQIAVYRDPRTGQPVGAKVRDKDKNFCTVGKLPCLYGQWLWSAGGKMLTITEGEIDALSRIASAGQQVAGRIGS
jgi:twinkle protein